MSGKFNLTSKVPQSKTENSASQAKKTNLSHSINSPIDQILFLQRTVGNQAVERLLKSGVIQAKLTIGQPGDVYEQEADRVAAEVMRMPDASTAGRKGDSEYDQVPKIQRVCTECEEELHRQEQNSEFGHLELVRSSKQELDRKTGEIQVQRMCSECKEAFSDSVGAASSRDSSRQACPELNRRDGAPEVTPSVESQINSVRGGGQPLSESARAFFEPRFGQDFSHVRIHTDSSAGESAKTVNALAYTVGQDVVFSGGQYSPETESGKKLIAHELTHVVQQGNEKSLIRRKIQFDSPSYIRENPIQRILGGQPAGGLTTPTVNSNQPVDLKQARELFFKAIEPQEMSYNPSTKECAFEDFDIKVSANVVVFTEPDGKKWTMNLPGSDIKGTSACNKKKNVPVVMTGKPSSEAAGKWIEKNEQEHVDDLKKLYDKYLEPHFKWVLSLKGKGDDTKKCQESLMSELGNKGALVVRDFSKDWTESVEKRDEGGKHTLKNDIKIKTNCSKIEIESSKR